MCPGLFSNDARRAVGRPNSHQLVRVFSNARRTIVPPPFFDRTVLCMYVLHINFAGSAAVISITNTCFQTRTQADQKKTTIQQPTYLTMTRGTLRRSAREPKKNGSSEYAVGDLVEVRSV